MKVGTCVHFTGMQNKECKAGVNYRQHVGGPDFGWAFRMPCIKKYASADSVKCAKYQEPTAEQVAEFEQSCKAAINRLIVTFPLSEKIKREHKGKSWQGVEECPVCKGRLHLSHAAINGHVWGKCETKGCVSWVE
jgi:hypothetical protein